MLSRLPLAGIVVYTIAVALVAALILLPMKGGPESTRVVAGLVLGALVGMFLDPFKQKVLLVLQGPKLEVELDEYFLEGAPRRIYLRLRVTNAKERTAAACRAYLAKIETYDVSTKQYKPFPFRDTFPLNWAFEQVIKRLDIPMGISRYADLALFRDNSPGFVPQISTEEGKNVDAPRYWEMCGAHGRFRLTVFLTADGTSPEAREVAIDCPGGWPPTYQISRPSRWWKLQRSH
ncbi:MAG TPA: hypothetical protein VG055_13105 [Planctomycetaceae bacterium]|nr:hypothetical protein [Planctomycetaceae bacterium]